MSHNMTYPSGMVRGVTEGKINFLLVRDGPMLKRWARLLTVAAADKGERNWMKARTEADLKRFRESLDRHVAQYQDGDTDEDHAAAIMFNVNGAEFVRARIAEVEAGPCLASLSGVHCILPGGHVPRKHVGLFVDGTVSWET